MVDNHSVQSRHLNMVNIKSINTKPEIIVRKYLFSQGFRYKKNDRKLPGKPDIVLPKFKTVIFINGCFWHKHDCSRFRWPSTNVDYWKNKIDGNTVRDKQNYRQLEQMGWRVIVVWECELKKATRSDTLENIAKKIKNTITENN